MNTFIAPFTVYGKYAELRYSVRDSQGQAVCTCAYNGGAIEDREAAADLIVEALNLHADAVAAVKAKEVAQK